MNAHTDIATLVLNAGSSSIKFAVFVLRDGDVDPQAVIRGQVGGIGHEPFFQGHDESGAELSSGGFEADAKDHATALAGLLAWLDARADLPPIDGVGHRVVHGGTDFTEPLIVTDVVLGALDSLSTLAPHHQPHNVAAIRAVAGVWQHVPQVACFDTAFHASQPALARETGLPRTYSDAGIRRYGFHGLSYEYVVGALPHHSGAALPSRLIVLHLGNGGSLCAVRDGRSVATTMGYSTVDGIPMATRSGAVDPGALIAIMRRDGLDADGLEDLLYNRSGLLGMSGISAEMRTLLAHDDEAARYAVDFFAYRVAREIGSLSAALGGLDAMVFTGGIGANASAVRENICARCAWLGMELDTDANASGGLNINAPNSAVAVYAFDTDEELVIARHTRAALDA